jgi:hypothetical protein
LWAALPILISTKADLYITGRRFVMSNRDRAS